MTNTHINVGGHKITTNKVGQVHEITSLESGFSGTLYWSVNNGICTVNVWNLSVTGTATNRPIYKSLPKAKQSVVQALHLGNSLYGDWYIIAGTTQINLNNYIVGGMYASLTYPVADDWVES